MISIDGSVFPDWKDGTNTAPYALTTLSSRLEDSNGCGSESVTERQHSFLKIRTSIHLSLWNVKSESDLICSYSAP